MAADKLQAKLLASLKRHNPARVRAYAGDDDARDIAVPTRRRRWSAVIEAIDARSWTRVELLDKSGAVLGYVDNTEPAGDVEDIAVDARSARTRSDAEWIVNLVVRAQREAMSFRDSEVQALLVAQGNVVRDMSAGMRELSGIWREQRDAAAEVAAMQATAAAGDGSFSMKELMEAAPVIMQALPVIKSMLNGGATKAKG